MTKWNLALGFVVAFASVALLSAQNPANPAFEVASVKLNKSGPDSIQRLVMQPGDRVTIVNWQLRTLIRVAYPDVSEVIGGPSWVGCAGPTCRDADRFDVNAKAAAPTSREQLQLMLRALLADRFKLTVHTEGRAEPSWALVLARSDGKLGQNLRRATSDCAALRAALPPGEPQRNPCVVAAGIGRNGMRGVTLDQLAGALSRDAGRPVVDKTGLAGAFDWDLTYTPEALMNHAPDRFPTVDPNGPSIFTAVQEQLGLKLESQKSEGTILVIDHVEHPTEN